jgi:hypothetical protein
LGVEFGLNYECYGEGGLDGAVFIFSTAASARELGVVQPGKSIRTIRLTGWAMDGWRSSWWGDGLAFPFSDHAGFDELLTYAEQSAPRRIFTIGGYPELAKELRSRGFEAWHLSHGPSPVL